ncbi:MAG: HIT family protein [Flavobacteriales bacterium]|jgi:histidine triad (HIT) family protein
MSSIFSKIIAGDIPCYKIDENEEFLAFLDIMPLAHGHVLVIPKIEVDYIFDIEDDLLSRMMVFAKSVAKKLRGKIECKRIGVAIIGLEVPHAHIHLVPLQSVSDINFEKAKLSLTSEELESIAREINS